MVDGKWMMENVKLEEINRKSQIVIRKSDSDYLIIPISSSKISIKAIGL